MKKMAFAMIVVLLMITCKKSSPNSEPANPSIIGKWQLSAFQSDGGSGDVSWHPADSLHNGYLIFKSDSMIFDYNFEQDTALYKITAPGIFYLYRGIDSFRMVYTISSMQLTFSNAYCSEACGQKLTRVQ